jgi:hypothetical protein
LRLPCAEFDFSDLEASVLDFDSGEEHNADSDRPESGHQPVSLISAGSSEDCGVSQFEAYYRWELKSLSEADLMEIAGLNAGNDLLRRENQRSRADLPVQGAEPPIRGEQLTSDQPKHYDQFPIDACRRPAGDWNDRMEFGADMNKLSAKLNCAIAWTMGPNEGLREKNQAPARFRSAINATLDNIDAPDGEIDALIGGIGEALGEALEKPGIGELGSEVQRLIAK